LIRFDIDISKERKKEMQDAEVAVYVDEPSAAFQPSGTVVFDDGSELTSPYVGYATGNDYVNSGSDSDGVGNTDFLHTKQLSLILT
jgi:hypothetical protein